VISDQRLYHWFPTPGSRPQVESCEIFYGSRMIPQFTKCFGNIYISIYLFFISWKINVCYFGYKHNKIYSLHMSSYLSLIGTRSVACLHIFTRDLNISVFYFQHIFNDISMKIIPIWNVVTKLKLTLATIFLYKQSFEWKTVKRRNVCIPDSKCNVRRCFWNISTSDICVLGH